ncbi:MAG TPA: 3-oxoacyl-[acyl-carrier-protein] reductase [candidate division WOR-3 bacterium]|uniref:3-oxoacyl-[acyl-carrier-protein] reductase n=1 Tax=candidate division WOR-3 bacterium TaxID=2052148 RepID=A0A7V0T5B5_UNCW3|nr:3-oxoacyl-[acyl-carrier-protein] reductase [candidate division WOR-3 bacterium]
MSGIEGRTAIVTGAGAGIGREIALRLAGAGAKVAACDVVEEGAQECAAAITAAGGEARAYANDVSDAAAVAELCARAAGELGGIHILINNAGITRDALLLRMSEQDWDAVLAVNLKGAFNFVKACARPMMKERWGRVVNIASVVGQMGNAGQANYAAAKAGMIGLTKSAARELAPRGITVNAVAPGFIETAMTRKLDEQARSAYARAIPLGRFGTPGDVADACLFLCSAAAAYITGQVIRVDGGMLM